MAYDQKLVELSTGKINRLAANMPPRHGKSLLARWFAFNHLIHYPQDELILGTAGSSLARQHGIAIRNWIDEFGSYFGLYLEQRQHDDLRLRSGGGVRCVGINTGVFGRGARIVITDDLYGSTQDITSAAHRDKVARWLGQVMGTRLTPDGGVLNIGSRQHSDDIWGRMEAAEQEGGDKWVKIVLPVGPNCEPVWPEVWPKPLLLAKKAQFEATGQLRDWQSQYELEPPQGDGLAEWPKRYFENIKSQVIPESHHKIARVLALDPSKGTAKSTADWMSWSDVTVTNPGTHYWCHQTMRKGTISEAEDETVLMLRRNRYDRVVVEGNFGQHLIAENIVRKCKELGIYCPMRKHESRLEKIARIRQGLEHPLEEQRIHILPSPGENILLRQLKFFPYDTHDDGPDSLNMAIYLLEEMRAGR